MPGPQRTRQRCSGAGGGFGETERTGPRSDGRKQGRNGADGCGEDRALLRSHTATQSGKMHGIYN